MNENNLLYRVVYRTAVGNSILINNTSLKLLHSRWRMLRRNFERHSRIYLTALKSDFSLFQLQCCSYFDKIREEEYSKRNISQFRFPFRFLSRQMHKQSVSRIQPCCERAPISFTHDDPDNFSLYGKARMLLFSVVP